jgi:hypothetical protein
MNKIYDGKKLARCFEVASATWKEIECLILIFNKTIEESLVKNNFRYEKLKKRSEQFDDTNWVGTGVGESFGILGFREKKPGRYLGYQISVLGDGMSLAGEPLIHFIFWNYPLDFSDTYVGFPFDTEWGHVVESDRLILWPDPDDGKPEWMFSIRLTSINDEDDVTRIVQAMTNLLKNNPEGLLLPPDLPGLVFYRLDGGELKVIESHGETQGLGS